MLRRSPYPELIVAVASSAWGLFWIPLRAFERGGLDAGWAVLSQFLVPLLVLLPFAIWQRVKGNPTGIAQWRSGVFVSLAVGLYLESLLFTDVARALILFYTMPAWGTLLDVVVLKRQLTKWRALALTLSLLGLAIILGVGSELFHFNIGDLMALLAGLLFSIGAVIVRQSPEDETVFSQLFAFFFYGAIATFLLTYLPIEAMGTPPNQDELVTLLPWLVISAAGFLIPVMTGIYFGSRYVDPGRLGIFLQFEALFGIGSAALWAGEPFGLPQLLGTVLVVAAGLIEVLGVRGTAPSN